MLATATLCVRAYAQSALDEPRFRFQLPHRRILAPVVDISASRARCPGNVPKVANVQTPRVVSHDVPVRALGPLCASCVRLCGCEPCARHEVIVYLIVQYSVIGVFSLLLLGPLLHTLD